MDGRTAHTPTNQSNVNKTQVDTIDGLVPLVPIALSRLGVASERAALKKDIKASFFFKQRRRHATVLQSKAREALGPCADHLA